MQIGVLQICQSFGYKDTTDAQTYDEELALAVRADQLGFDLVSMVEHHFEDYSFCPDNFVYLAHVAALTKNINLMTGAVIVPWNAQPIRIAEKAALVDQLSGNRLILGLGRGLSRREYEQFAIDMNESRDRFDEATPLILEALETGWMPAHKGKFFETARAPIRPAPTRSYKDRFTQVAMSSDSVIEAARNRAKMMQFTYKPMEKHKEEIATYAAEYRKLHKEAPPVPYFADVSVCDTDAGRCEKNARNHIIAYLHSVMHHYEMMSDHYADTKGYKEYGESARMMQEAGLEAVCESYLESQVWGTPQQCLDKIEARRQQVGDFDLLIGFRAGGATNDIAMRSLETFAAKVMPELRTWDMATKIAA